MAWVYDTTINWDPNVNLPTFGEGPPGSRLKVAYAYPAYFSIPAGVEATTYEIDIFAISPLGQEVVTPRINEIQGQLISQAEEVLVAYMLWERPVMEISLPSQFCLPGTQLCWTPPFAGQVLISGYNYRLWFMTIPLGAMPEARAHAAPLEARGAVQIGAVAIIALVIGLLMLIGGLMLISDVKTGKIKVEQARDFVKDFLNAPGDNVSRGLTGPLIAFGFSMIAMGIAVPWAVSSGKAEVSLPLGPGGRVGGEIGVQQRRP